MNRLRRRGREDINVGVFYVHLTAADYFLIFLPLGSSQYFGFLLFSFDCLLLLLYFSFLSVLLSPVPQSFINLPPSPSPLFTPSPLSRVIPSFEKSVISSCCYFMSLFLASFRLHCSRKICSETRTSRWILNCDCDFEYYKETREQKERQRMQLYVPSTSRAKSSIR